MINSHIDWLIIATIWQKRVPNKCAIICVLALIIMQFIRQGVIEYVHLKCHEYNSVAK